MDDTANFVLLTCVATLAVLLLFAAGRSPLQSPRAGRGFLYLCLALGLVGVTATLLSVTGVLPRTPAVRLAARVLLFRGWVVIGVSLAATLVALAVQARRHTAGSTSGAHASPLAAKDSIVPGLCVTVAAALLSVEIGKLTHDADMRRFFVDSGLPVWLHYSTVALEFAGAVGLLLPRWRRPSAAGLLLIMLGAIGTHVRNGDPLSDSLEAIHLLVILAGILVLTGSTRPRASTSIQPHGVA